jgi:ribosome recycling factor
MLKGVSGLEDLLNDLKRRMNGVLEGLMREFAGLRTGRASASLLEPIMVEAYGSMMPITQVGTISIPESRMLTVQVWDTGLVKSVEKAIRDANLGLNPSADGQVVRVPLPDLNEERRKELVKVAGKYSEQAKVSVRNVRRDGMDQGKKQEKAGDISEDDERRLGDEIQKLTDSFIKKIDEMLVQKEKDIMHV